MTQVDLLVHSASQLLTLTAAPQRGRALGKLNLIEQGAVAIDQGRIIATGPSDRLRAECEPSQEIDAQNRVVLPGFIDPHTHAVFAGDRAGEFQERVSGVSYLEIMERGGGINATVEATRQASVDDLVAQSIARLKVMLAHGTTTVEVKTGYGLDLEHELKMLEAIVRLGQELPLRIVPTLLGAHAVPSEMEGDSERFVDSVIGEMLPGVRSWWASRQQGLDLPFFDVFCERGAFSPAQTARMLRAARDLGYPLKLHADEFEGLGCTALAVELGAASVDHLVQTPDQDIRALGASDTVAVSLPLTPFGLGEADYTPARRFLEAGAMLALASDLNPGTAWCESLQMALAVACRQMRLTPEQAIAAATINAAASLQLEGEVGSLTPGKSADLIILGVSDYRHLGYRFGTNLVRTVIANGQVVWADEGTRAER